MEIIARDVKEGHDYKWRASEKVHVSEAHRGEEDTKGVYTWREEWYVDSAGKFYKADKWRMQDELRWADSEVKRGIGTWKGTHMESIWKI